MAWAAQVSLALATLGGSGIIASLLWMALAHGVWGHIAGPPPGMDPKAARVWAWERALGHPSPYRLRWGDVRRAAREGRWREIWPIGLMALGTGLVLTFLPAGLTLGTPRSWLAAVGPAAVLALAGGVWRALRE